MQQFLFRTDAREEHWDKHRRQQDAHSRTKSQTPTEGVDEQAQITGMADHAIAAEPAQYEDWPEPQPATYREEPDASQRTVS